MDAKGKIDRISSLNASEVIEAFIQIITTVENPNVEMQSNVIISTKKTLLGEDISVYLVYNQLLGGDINIVTFVEDIKNVIETNTPNSINIVSNYNISNGFKSKLNNEFNTYKINYVGRDNLIELLDAHFSTFWKHDDATLINYENYYIESIAVDSDLKKLKIFNDKYQKLLDVYIEPRLSYFYDNKKTKTPVRKRCTTDDIIHTVQPILLSGGAGSGKSTLLRKIGEKLIKNNQVVDTRQKSLPIIFNALDIHESNCNIEDLLKRKIELHFPGISLKGISEKYTIYLLIDSLDEFDNNECDRILSKLNELSSKYKYRYIISSRNNDRLSSIMKEDFQSYQIERFNNEQVKRFISRFFLSDSSKAESLLDALRDNRIIERLSITPLTLSLISILYEENNLEIPATIADIYDNFNSLIIGRLTVSSKIEFIDISFKERILSLYALHLLETDTHKPLLKDAFIKYFIDYYEDKTLPLKTGKLEEVLEYLVANTGVLILKDNKWVQFSHDSYLEYYAAIEIFKHRRDKEEELVKNFFDFRWQNTAIFYAGKSKDMPILLSNITKRLSSANKIQEYMSGVLGCGYLLQALYQTDNIIRKEALMEALKLNNLSTDTLSKLAADDNILFKNYSLPILQIMNLFYFHETFNSITLKEPLLISFNEIYNHYKQTGEAIHAFNAICLSLILDSKRINYSKAIETIIEDTTILKNPALYTVVDFSLGLLGGKDYEKIKAEIRGKYYPKISEPVRKLIQLPASKLRFTQLDMLSSDKKVKLIVEGKTDAEILEHAYYVLTNGHSPYWNIKVAGNESGGAAEVAKNISNCKPYMTEEDIVIGIFDHDAKGLQEFRGLKNSVFEAYINNTQRKHLECQTYALLLPVPGELEEYLVKEQQYNLFEIEHYLPIDFLKNADIVEVSPINGLYKIKDNKSAKVKFANSLKAFTEKETYKYFVDLFLAIDKITGVQIDYNN